MLSILRAISMISGTLSNSVNSHKSFLNCFSGDFPCPVFDIVLKRITIRGSIVGTRKDMEEAIGFASRGNDILSLLS
jgi:hypothetical protein